MLDIKRIREETDLIKKGLSTRDEGLGHIVDQILEADLERRKSLTEVENLKAKRKTVSKEIGALMGQKKHDEAEVRKAETKDLGKQISELDAKVSACEQGLEEAMLTLPNLPHSSVPIGENESENVTEREWGQKPNFDFDPVNHVELCDRLGLIDFNRGVKIAGSGFLLYTGWGAKLERALIQFLLEIHTEENSYMEVSPPYIVNRDVMYGVGQFPKFSDQAYAVQEGEDETTMGKYFLLPTAEAPVANIHREEILKQEQLPIQYCAYSPCFRAEAGAAGVNTRGMIRVHQFDKVELIKIVEPENSYDELESLLKDAEGILQRLGLHYRVLQLCTGDMGFGSAKTFDIEVWAPGQQQYLEVSSCSNCEDFQARRMNLRYKSKQKGNQFPHILNGSGTALARLFVAFIETYQQKDGSILIPEILQPFLKSERIPVANS
ncbi:MAG TPA: serine--tRNA ligase [Verrucomicrobiales bacterium]|nr:serine--tRNA ligase [Verrucomicrobiales bacterium]